MRFFFILFCLFVLPGAALAQRGLKVQPSTFYNVAIAEAHLRHQTLDPERLVASDPSLDKMSEQDKAKYIPAMIEKVKDLDQKYAIGTTPIIVRMFTRPEVFRTPAAIKIGFDPKNLPYFPFDVMGRTISVVPNNIGQFTIVPLDNPDDVPRAEALLSDWGAQIVIEMIPTAISAESISLDNVNQYLMAAEVSYISISNRNGEQIIWSYVNPKYSVIYDNGLGNLYGGASVGAGITPAP